MAEPISVVIEDDNDAVRVDQATGDVMVSQPDGGVVVQFGAYRQHKQAESGDFYRNLADDIGEHRLGQIAEELYAAVDADDKSRQQYLQIRARGIDLLGIKLEQPRSNVGESSAAAEGMSSVTNPLLLDACLKGWANAQAEMLPAAGPVKIRDDGDETALDDELAERLERDMNHYLTKGAPEYYPDTSQMLLWGVYFSGSGVKKVYRCPLRRRPVSDSVDAKDFIVSDTTKDLRACERITHQIPMRSSVLKRMILSGAYRDIALNQPPTPVPNAIDAKIAGIQGTTTQNSRPEDQPYTIWEVQCEWNLEQYAPGKFRNKDIPLPYLVTMDKDSRQVLAIRRDWNEDDEECERKRMYVKYPYIPGPGFYGTGLLNVLGNSSAAMTAAWREALDAGMYANFPAFLIAKQTGRQLTSDFRLAPGTGLPLDTGGLPIGQIAMGLPYKDITPGLMALMDKITDQSKSVGAAADIPVGEGIQNVPVGTMLANIEQATKVMAAAHKGMHQAQGEEFDLILDLFRENPEDFWRGNKECPKDFWNPEKFIEAIDRCRLVPVSDPNVPSHLHRVAKSIALVQLITNPIFTARMDPDETLRRVLHAMREDANGLVIQPPPQEAAPPPLADVAKMVDAQAKKDMVPIKALEAQTRAQTAALDIQGKKDIATVGLAKDLVVQHGETEQERLRLAREDKIAHRKGLVEDRSHALDLAKSAHGAFIDVAKLNKPDKPKPKGKK